MKKYIFTAIMAAAALFATVSCNNEEEITPSGDYSPIRGGFPQGESKLDSIINNIKNEYDVYLIYKGINEKDLNRDWVSTCTGDIYVAGDEEDREIGDIGWDLPADQLPLYVDFFNNHIFDNISKEIANSALPVKIYMINGLRTEPRDYGEENSSSGTDNSDPHKSIKLGTFDSWAVSLDIVTSKEGKEQEYALRQMRCILILEIIKNAIDKGDIDSPDEFWYGFNFSVDQKIDNNDPTKDNYKYKLGFVDRINDNFGTGPKKQVWPNDILTSSYYWEKNKYPDYNLFTTYIKNIIWQTPEEFERRYPSDKYPMIKEKREIVVNHMLNKYGIKLLGIANGPQNKTEE